MAKQWQPLLGRVIVCDLVFANEHRALPYLRAGLPAEYADGASQDAANGVALIQDTQCRREREGRLRGATAGDDITASLRARRGDRAHGVCSRPAAPDLNATAAAAWRRYEATKGSILTAEQVARLATWVDHPRTH